MALADEKVISGDYVGASCALIDGNVIIRCGTDVEQIKLTKETVKKYEVIDAKVGKSTGSCIIRVIVGMTIVGLLQLLLSKVLDISSISIDLVFAALIAAVAGAELSGVYIIAIEFSDGKRSLVEISEKSYKQLIKDIF